MENLELKEVVKKELVFVDVEANSKEEVISKLSNELYQKGYLSDKDQFIKDTLAREKEGLTGIGNGIAIPHGKSEGVKKTTITLAKLAEPMEWGALDDLPVEVILLFSVKKTDETATHIKLLQKVSIMLADDGFLHRLTEAKTSEELYELIINR